MIYSFRVGTIISFLFLCLFVQVSARCFVNELLVGGLHDGGNETVLNLKLAKNLVSHDVLSSQLFSKRLLIV